MRHKSSGANAAVKKGHSSWKKHGPNDGSPEPGDPKEFSLIKGGRKSSAQELEPPGEAAAMSGPGQYWSKRPLKEDRDCKVMPSDGKIRITGKKGLRRVRKYVRACAYGQRGRESIPLL